MRLLSIGAVALSGVTAIAALSSESAASLAAPADLKAVLRGSNTAAPGAIKAMGEGGEGAPQGGQQGGAQQGGQQQGGEHNHEGEQHDHEGEEHNHEGEEHDHDEEMHRDCPPDRWWMCVPTPVPTNAPTFAPSRLPTEQPTVLPSPAGFLSAEHLRNASLGFTMGGFLLAIVLAVGLFTKFVGGAARPSAAKAKASTYEMYGTGIDVSNRSDMPTSMHPGSSNGMMPPQYMSQGQFPAPNNPMMPSAYPAGSYAGQAYPGVPPNAYGQHMPQQQVPQGYPYGAASPSAGQAPVAADYGVESKPRKSRVGKTIDF